MDAELTSVVSLSSGVKVNHGKNTLLVDLIGFAIPNTLCPATLHNQMFILLSYSYLVRDHKYNIFHMTNLLSVNRILTIGFEKVYPKGIWCRVNKVGRNKPVFSSIRGLSGPFSAC